jgi:hypothetical protein
MSELQNNKWHLMVCELHNPRIHGKTKDSNKFIETHYLVYDVFDAKTNISYLSTCFDETLASDDDDESSDEDEEIDKPVYMKNIIKLLKENYTNLPSSYKHPTIRNYRNIISKPEYIKPEIGIYIILPTQEAIAILKTVWIRIIQRKWKQIFKERKRILQNRKCPESLHVREITGKWSAEYQTMPSLRGMLSNLKL